MIAAVINIFIGLWVMLAPAMLGFGKTASDHSYVVGPLVITFAIAAIWEVNRSARYLNIPAGLWLAASAILFSFSGPAFWNSLICGIAICLLSLIKGKITGKYGGGWRSLFRKTPQHDREDEVPVLKNL